MLLKPISRKQMVCQQRHAWTNSQIIWKGKLEPSAAHHDIKPQHQCRLNMTQRIKPRHDICSERPLPAKPFLRALPDIGQQDLTGLSQQSPSLGLCRISANKKQLVNLDHTTCKHIFSSIASLKLPPMSLSLLLKLPSLSPHLRPKCSI